jgi:hypothetical protein
MPLGVAGEDVVFLNHDSLWSGGPFANKVSILLIILAAKRGN